MIKEIQLKGLASAPSGHSSDDGLLSVSIGCMPSGGELQAIPPLAPVLTLPQGHKAVLVHAVGGGAENFIVTAIEGGSTKIMWTCRTSGELALIAAVEGECLSFAAQGRMVAVATPQGLRFMAWRGSGYAYLGAAPALPEIEFGMQRAGYLSIPERFEVPGYMAASASQGSGAGAWLTHPSAQAEAQSGESTAKAISRAMARAVAGQVEAKGLFYQPFLLRYGLRLPDGSLPWVSPPVLMCPWALPPCLALDSVAEADGRTVATLSSASCPVFRLRRRILSGLPQAWADEVASVDVFITPPIATYDADIPGQGFASYKSVAGISDSDFAGCWAESGDSYASHTLAQAGLADCKAWAFARSGDLSAAIRQAASFYLAESIPVSQIAASAAFESAAIGSTSRRAIEGGERLYSNAGMPWRLVPDRLDSACGRIFAIGGSLRAPEPMRLQALASACGGASESATEVAVWVKRGGEVAVARRQWEAGAAPDLSAAFPRMLAYPCREAYMMQISQGSRHWRLPLAPHPVLDCACWHGSLSAKPDLGFSALWADSADMDETPLLSAADCFAPSVGANAFAFGHPVCSPAGRVMGVRAAVGTLSPGQLGQFAAYALCSGGVLALGAGSFEPKQLLSSRGCISPAAIASIDSGVAYGSDCGVMLLKGWKCESLGGSLQACGAVRQWPELARLAAMAGASLPLPSLAEALAGGSIAYDSRRSRLLVLSGGWPCAYVCSLSSGAWGVAMLPAAGAAIGAGCIMLADGTVADAELDCEGEAPCLVVTHPIKADRPVAYKRLAAAMAEGRMGQRTMSLAVYGSNDLVGWSLVAASPGRSISGLAGSPWRYYAGALAGRLGPSDAISALTLRFRG